MTFVPLPMLETVCIANVYSKIVQLEVCITCLSRGMGINDTYNYIHIIYIYIYIYTYTHMCMH